MLWCKTTKSTCKTLPSWSESGRTVQVIAGLTPSDRLIANPSAGLLDGQTVQVVDAPPQNSGLGDKASPQQASDK